MCRTTLAVTFMLMGLTAALGAPLNLPKFAEARMPNGDVYLYPPESYFPALRDALCDGAQTILSAEKGEQIACVDVTQNFERRWDELYDWAYRWKLQPQTATTEDLTNFLSSWSRLMKDMRAFERDPASWTRPAIGAIAP